MTDTAEYDLVDVLALTPDQNEPVSYRDLVLRRQYNTSAYTVVRNGRQIGTIDVSTFDTERALAATLDGLVHAEMATLSPDAARREPDARADGGTVASSPPLWRLDRASIVTKAAFVGSIGILIYAGEPLLAAGLLLAAGYAGGDAA
jgi:hypothetical protein